MGRGVCALGRTRRLRLSVKAQTVFWVWNPHYPAGSANYEVFARCERFDADGNFVGKNKVIVKGLRFVAGGLQLSIPNLSGKIKNGETGFLTREVSSLGTLAGSPPVIGEASILAKGKFKAGDTLRCFIDVTESPSAGAAVRTE